MFARLLLALTLVGCAARPVPPAEPPVPATPAVAPAPPALPPELAGKAEVLSPDDAAYAGADLAGAVKPAGEGGLSEGYVVRLTADVSVYRMWSGPEAVDARGNTNRLGQWWTYDPPRGTAADYRARYAVCAAWNELDWVATCALRAGAIVVVGPGQSVSDTLCGAPGEAYAPNPTDWQVYVAKAWTRTGEGGDLACPAPEQDRPADPAELARAP